MAKTLISPAEKTDFDAYAAEYRQAVNASIGASGDTVEVFARLKAKYVTRLVTEFFAGKILDYGCGIGLLSQALRDALPDSQAVGYDPSTASIENIDPRLSSQVRFTSDIDSVGYGFDVIVMANVLHHVRVEERDDLVQSLERRLARGGRLIVFEHNPANPLTRRAVANCEFDRDAVLLRPASIHELMKHAGLAVERSQFITFFPHWLAWLRPAEPLLGWCPLGAQVAVVGTRQ